MLEQHHRPAVRRTASPGHSHPPRPRAHRRLSPQTRAALAETRLLPVECSGVPRGHASAPPLAFEAPVRLLPLTPPAPTPVEIREVPPPPAAPEIPARGPHTPRPAARPARRPRSSRAAALAARRSVRKTQYRVVAMVLLLGGFVAIPRLSFSGQHTVTLAIDDEVRVHSTRADTVGEVLAEQGIVVGRHDHLDPEPGTKVRDNLRVAVRRAREILVDVNGAVTTRWTTADSTDEILAELGIAGATVESGSSGEGTLQLSHTWRLVLRHDGREVEMATMATTVGEALRRAGVEYDADDEVTPSPDTLLDASITDVRVVRVDRRVLGVHVPLAAPVERHNDPDVMRGKERVLRAGRVGVRLDTFEVTYRDGAESERMLLDAQVLTVPESRVIGVGTKAPRDASAPTGRTRSVPPGWSAAHSAVGRATWYQYKSGTCAHNTLAKGTLLRVTNLDTGRSTTCVVADRGIRDPANMVDLAHDVFDDIAPRSQGVARVRIEW